MHRKPLTMAVLSVLALLVTPMPAQARFEAALVKDYTGRHPDDYVTQFERVRLLVRQAQMEASSGLGLIQYREGFQYPFMIRFEDGAPPGLESALAYVRLMQNAQGFAQELVVNMDANSRDSMEFDKIFYHEMTHAVLNDAIGGEASMRVPHWVQEGLAQYISNEGNDRVTYSAHQYRRSQVHALLFELDGPVYGAAYPQYYLAIDYLHEKHTVNAVQALVRNLIKGMAIRDAVEDCTGLPWMRFQKEVREYSLKIFSEKALPDY